MSDSGVHSHAKSCYSTSDRKQFDEGILELKPSTTISEGIFIDGEDADRTHEIYRQHIHPCISRRMLSISVLCIKIQ